MENQLAVVLPNEVAEIAKNVSVEKRNEVQTILNHVFNGVAKMREQLESISVKDQNDEVSMKLAGTVRLAVKRERLDAEKKFDAKRAEVQQEMLGFKTLDSLYLKAKQIMQIQTKELEEIALFKEETKKRFEAEQKELKVQQRMLKVAKVAPEMARSEFENMSDETFEMFFSGIEKAYNDKIEAEKKAEAERIEKEKAEVAERERIRKENERLKAEAEAKEKQLIAERAKAEAERKAIEEAAKKEREENERKLKSEQETARIAAEKAATEKAKLEAEIKAKAEAEAKERKESEAKVIAEQKAKEAAEKKAKNAPDKTKLIELALQIDGLNMPEIKSEEAQKILADVKTLLSKVSVFIREKSSGL
jgi:hypothetical protein